MISHNKSESMPSVRILHLEDNARDAEMIRELLVASGRQYELVLVENRKQFEETLAQQSFDVIICDFNVPDFDGLSAVKLAKRDSPQTPVIIVSGAIDATEAVECLKAGATDYLLKQRLERLPSAVERALEEAAETRKLRLAEAALRKAESGALRIHRQFHDLFEFAPDATVMTNSEGHVEMVNQRAELLFGYQRSELVGQPIEKLIPASSRDGHVALRQQFLSAATPRAMGAGRANIRGVKKDGTEFPIDVSLSPLESDNGTSVVAAIRDVTERERAQRMMLRSQRLGRIGTLAGGVAHDLNNVLAPILMITELLRMQHPDAVELIDTVESSAKRGAEMVRQLLTFARGVEGARLLVQPQHLLAEMEKIIRGTFPKNIQVRNTCAAILRPILGDVTQLHQVLLNLCVNARDAMPNGGTLTLGAENTEVDATFANEIPEAKPGPYVVWRVTDTGTGIPPEALDRILEPFFSTKATDQGTGLGLSTCSGIVKSHGGFLRVSTSPGSGSTFAVYLPADVSGASEASLPADAKGAFRGNGEMVLVVDDEAAVRDVASAVLTALNFQVVTATDGAEALSKVAQNRGELRAVITDVHMPHMDGFTLIRVMKRLAPEAGIIITSGHLEEREANEIKALGVSALLDKPFTQGQLVAALKTTLQK